MPCIKANWREFAQSQHGLSSVMHSSAVLLGSLFLAWPAFYNGFSLLYPDSMTYLDDGRVVVRALLLHQLSPYYGVRSLFYSVGILPWHRNISAWPVIALQCFLVAYVVWLVVRSVSPRHTATRYLILVAFLSLLSSVSWYASFIMPDILGPVLYLSIYLLVFAEDALSRVERLTHNPIVWWAVTAHSTHLLLAAALCVLQAFLVIFERLLFRRCIAAIGRVAVIVAVAAAAQLALNAYSMGRPR